MATIETGLAGAELTAGDLPGAGSPVTHSQFYTTALHRSLLEIEKVDTRGIILRAAAEASFQHLSERLGWGAMGPAARLKAVAETFREMGLGRLDLSDAGKQGGEARVTSSHLAEGWLAQYPSANRPVCVALAGFIEGALAAVHGRRYEVRETRCLATGSADCHFEVNPQIGPLDYLSLPPVEYSPGPAPLDLRKGPVDGDTIAAVLFPEISGPDSDGRITAFGARLSRLWADYYARVSYRVEQEIPRVMGQKFANLAAIVLTEAGHVCGYHTFGGIMLSEPWRERIAPRLVTPEERVHALVAVVNTFGWGHWRVEALYPRERLIVHVRDGYEAIGYRQLFGEAKDSKCFLARGLSAAIMNLVYVGDLENRPELTPSYYNRLFRSPMSYRAVETRCQATGEPNCEVIVNPLSPNLGSLAKVLAGGRRG